MDIEPLVQERLAFALGQSTLAATYRELLLSVGTKFLSAQFHHHTVCQPLIALPGLVCEACGVGPRRSVGVTTAWFLLQVSAHLLDKVEDQELNPAVAYLSEPGVVMNISTGMIFVAEWILNHLELDCVDAGTAWDIQKSFNETVLTVCSGQHLDLSVSSPDLPTCWKIAESKSGAAFGLACYAGARLATRSSDSLSHLERFGRHLGTILQIADDVEDLNGNIAARSGNQQGAMLIHAYLNHVDEQAWNGHSPERDSDQFHAPTMSGPLLYLHLEAMKYAEMARAELACVNLAPLPHQDLLALITHLSHIGVSPN